MIIRLYFVFFSFRKILDILQLSVYIRWINLNNKILFLSFSEFMLIKHSLVHLVSENKYYKRVAEGMNSEMLNVFYAKSQLLRVEIKWLTVACLTYVFNFQFSSTLPCSSFNGFTLHSLWARTSTIKSITSLCFHQHSLFHSNLLLITTFTQEPSPGSFSLEHSCPTFPLALLVFLRSVSIIKSLYDNFL